MKIQSVRGTRDFYPDEMALRNWLFEQWRAASRRAGFVEVDGPVLEPLDLYTEKSGPEIAEQLYWLTDKGGRELALRPEFTPTLARMIAARQAALPTPIRWFNISRCFRYERAQRGRLREFFQWNVDLIGVEGEIADAECISLAVDGLKAVGLGPEDVEIRVSDRRLLSALVQTYVGVSEDLVPSVFAILDKRDKVPAEALAGMLDEAGLGNEERSRLERVLTFRDLGELDAIGSVQTPAESLKRLFGLLADYGIADWCRFDIGIVRGLAYYTGPVWEVYDRKGEFRAIFGGGRYDRLLGDVGGQSMPACGFACGDAVLGLLLKERGLGPPEGSETDYYVAAWNPDWPKVLQMVRHLRSRGKRVQFDLKGGKINRQSKNAISSGARFVVVIGDKEAPWPKVLVRDLRQGTVSQPMEYRKVGDEGQ
ncbi:MAG TPA: histidine--tRNA ligase [Phycisphaerae bacterium]|nr:histidine--tRNA ligase [Phycisphaerae bacterium]